MADPETKPDDTNAAAARPPRSSRLVPALLALNTVALVALLGVQVFSLRAWRQPAAAEPPHGAAAPAAEKAAEHREAPGPMVRLADFVVHLRDPDADRYARVSFELELGTDKDKEGLAARTPQIRDTFLAYLSDCTTEELRGSEAIGRVKSALSRKLGEVAPAVAVRGLYVTELVVQ